MTCNFDKLIHFSLKNVYSGLNVLGVSYSLTSFMREIWEFMNFCDQSQKSDIITISITNSQIEVVGDVQRCIIYVHASLS